MATTLRLPPALKAEADALADRLGISLNALAAVALRDYLDGRPVTPRFAVPSASPPVSPVSVASPSAPAQSVKANLVKSLTVKTTAGRNDPCPCGARNAQGYPLKWKRCHGALRPS